MGIPVILRLSNLVACRRSINPRFALCSALILLVPCHQIIREIRFQLSSGSITKDSYELLADSGRDLKRACELMKRFFYGLFPLLLLTSAFGQDWIRTGTGL